MWWPIGRSRGVPSVGRGVANALGASYSNVVICELNNKIGAVQKKLK